MKPGDQEDLERLAAETHERAGSDPHEPVTSIALARAILGRKHVRVVDGSWLIQDGALARVRGDWQIWIRRELPPVKLAFAVAHELAEFVLHDTSLESEPHANFLAAAILAPRAFFRSVAREPDLPGLAKGIVATETMIALRWGEVTGQPTFVLTRSYQWQRGRPWAWPADVRANDVIPGVKTIRFTDAPERKALLADE